jgi:hypothetical protein
VLAISIETPSADRTLVLPDVSGTVLTSGNMPNVLESTSFTGHTTFLGGASFLNEDVLFGTRDAPDSAEGELNAYRVCVRERERERERERKKERKRERDGTRDAPGLCRRRVECLQRECV